MNIVFLVAMRSKDLSTHHGAVIVAPGNQIIATGYNGLPRLVLDIDGSRRERPAKYIWTEHSERNALYQAARRGIATEGCRLYVSGIPCPDCARGIIQCGLKEVVIDKIGTDNTPSHWREAVACSLQMFKEAMINVRYWTGTLVMPVRFLDGKILE